MKKKTGATNIQVWNTYHSSPKEIEKNEALCKAKNISDLIKLRDVYYSIIKESEGSAFFNRYDPNEPPEQAYYGFLYEDALKKVAFISDLIAQKRMSMFWYCKWSPNRDNIHKFARNLLEFIKKNPKLTYDEIVQEYGEESIIPLDFLIEDNQIEMIGNIDNHKWVIKRKQG